MHELSITHNIVAAVAERAGNRTVKSVLLQIGEKAGIDRQAIEFCFELCTQGTVLEGARLDVEPAGGTELLIRSMEVVDV